jgi:phosphatidylglycerol:prolipoprotein diacylglycerol transferase
VLFLILWVLSRRKRGDGLIIGTLIGLYGVFRIIIEFFREPDVQLGYVFGPLTMGQLLTVPMVLVGAWLVWRALRGGSDQVRGESQQGASTVATGIEEATTDGAK